MLSSENQETFSLIPDHEIWFLSQMQWMPITLIPVDMILKGTCIKDTPIRASYFTAEMRSTEGQQEKVSLLGKGFDHGQLG